MLDEEPGIDSLTEGGTKPEISGHVKLNSVHFRYPQRSDVRIFEGINIDVCTLYNVQKTSIQVKPGQTLALVGPSGCGKSTVISLMER